ncbi:conserved hypothetical protein [Tenacibaculum maritimum]|uniref:hypothetical protein n=1 Tax=Tenacibaculum maritimum TaxID=107401 RepID=UPI0012E6AAF2|nr:hypothetical protein [Tenacibaculum maritimum]CAA0234354.1 conserved hypothetical protein [Tenacibaculum maritimum]
MSVKITWTTLAKLSYYEEIDFINLKWNIQEVEKFVLLVEDFVESMSTGIRIGKIYPNNNIHSIVVSKQTTVFYREYPDKNEISLLLFWNNQKDSKTLKRLLKQV